MRPGRGPERDPEFVLAAQFGRKSVRAANDKNGALDRLVAPTGKPMRQASTVDILAALVEWDKHGVFGNCRRNRRCLLGNARGCVAGPAFRNFMDVEAAEAELAADVAEPLLVPLGELALRTLFQPADGNDDKTHEHFPAKWASVCQGTISRFACAISKCTKKLC